MVNFRMEIFLVKPLLVKSVLNPFGIIGFRKFFAHFRSPSSIQLIISDLQKKNPLQTFCLQRAYLRGTTFSYHLATAEIAISISRVLSANGDKAGKLTRHCKILATVSALRFQSYLPCTFLQMSFQPVRHLLCWKQNCRYSSFSQPFY